MGEKITIEGLRRRGWLDVPGVDRYYLEDCLNDLEMILDGGLWFLWWGKKNRMLVETFEELYPHLRHFGLIEPEPITISKVKKIVPKGLINYISEYQISFCLTEDLNAEFFESASGKRGSLWVNGSFLENLKTMQDLRDLCRLMGVTNETQL